MDKDQLPSGMFTPERPTPTSANAANSVRCGRIKSAFLPLFFFRCRKTFERPPPLRFCPTSSALVLSPRRVQNDLVYTFPFSTRLAFRFQPIL